MDVYGLIRLAVQHRLIVRATYNGHRRELCPHVLGRKDGRPQCLFYQHGGSSRSSLRAGGMNWRCLPVDGLDDVAVTCGEWHTHAYREAQSCIDEVDVQVAGFHADGRPGERKHRRAA